MSVEHATVARQVPPVRRGGVAVGLLSALFLLAAGSFTYAVSSADAAIDFALLTATFLYLMGVTQGGIVICAILRIVGAQWSKPYYRLAELCTLAFAPFAILSFLLIFIFARDALFYWLSDGAAASADNHLSPWLNIDWLFIRNLFGLLLFYGVSTVYALKALRPDLAAGSSRAADIDPEKVERELYLMSPFVILSFTVCSTLFAWDFGMMLIEHWHSTVFPIFFSFGNLFAGSASLVFFVAILGRSDATGSQFGTVQIRSLAMLITAFTPLWLYLFWSQFFVVWFGNLPRETDALWPQMYGHYAPYFWTMMAGCFFVPFAALVFAFVKRSVIAMTILAAGINLGVWLHKYLTVVPVFSPDDRPFDTWLDVVVAVGLLAGFLALFITLATRLPLYSHWEIARGPAVLTLR